MRTTKRSAQFVALAAGLALVAAACGSDDDSSSDTAAAHRDNRRSRDRDHGGTGHDRRCDRNHCWWNRDDGRRCRRCGDDDHLRHQPRRGLGRRHADHGQGLPVLERRHLNTPGSLSTVGYDQITRSSRAPPTSRSSIKFRGVRAVQEPVHRPVIKADAVAELQRRLRRLADNIPFSAGPWKIESWSPDQIVLVPNEATG